MEESIPSEVVLRLPVGRFFGKDRPYSTIVALVKGNELRNLYQKYKESLYAWNIRGYLGNRGINRAIYDTAKDRPADFYYFNNGVSAICTNYELKGNELHAQNFQIINGAQTISTLAKAAPNSDIDILLRVTLTQSVKTEKGFNRDIIQFNNSQNIVRVSDFRSNDPIQQWLDHKFKELRNIEALPPIFYMRKRAVGRRGTGYHLRLEELAKIRYAFLYEPTLVFVSPKRLWSMKEDDGVYEQALGVEGELQSTWSQEILDECLLAIALFFRIDQETRRFATPKSEFRFMRRLRFHALSLAGLFLKKIHPGLNLHGILRNKKKFDELFLQFWPTCTNVLEDVFTTAEEDGVTLFALVRNSERWDKMRKRFERRLALSSPVIEPTQNA